MGKKRGQRMTGWWFVGSLGEAAFFGILALFGLLTFATIVAWQLFSPETNVFPVGFGFWVAVIASASIMVIGGVGFVLRVLRVATSDEHRSFLAEQSQEDPWICERANHLADVIDSKPGRFHTIVQVSSSPFVCRVLGQKLGLFCSVALCIGLEFPDSCLASHAVSSFRQRIDWLLLLVLPLFLAVGIFATRCLVLPEFSARDRDWFDNGGDQRLAIGCRQCLSSPYCTVWASGNEKTKKLR